MKPNLLFVQTSQLEINAEIEKFCESFCDSHYVYLIRPNSTFREDSPAGLRFLSNPLDQLPGFAEVRSMGDKAVNDIWLQKTPVRDGLNEYTRLAQQKLDEVLK